MLAICNLSPITCNLWLPDDQAGFGSTDAHGARNASGHSVAERLQVRAFDEGDQVVAPRDGMDLLDHRAFKFHAW